MPLWCASFFFTSFANFAVLRDAGLSIYGPTNEILFTRLLRCKRSHLDNESVVEGSVNLEVGKASEARYYCAIAQMVDKNYNNRVRQTRRFPVPAYLITQLEEETVKAAGFRVLAARQAVPDSNFQNR